MSSKSNGAESAFNTMSSMMNMMPAPAVSGFAVSQKIALETAKFWARRMRAYADQVEALARCGSPNQLVAAQQQFLQRMQEDIAEETSAFSEIWRQNGNEVAKTVERAERGERPERPS